MVAVVSVSDRLLALAGKALSLTDARTVCNLIAFVYHLFAQFGVGRKSRVVLLNRRVGQHKFRLFGNIRSVKFYAVCKNLRDTFLPNTFAKMDEVARIEWKFVFKKSVRDIRGFKIENWSDFTEIVKSG